MVICFKYILKYNIQVTAKKHAIKAHKMISDFWIPLYACIIKNVTTLFDVTTVFVPFVVSDHYN